MNSSKKNAKMSWQWLQYAASVCLLVSMMMAPEVALSAGYTKINVRDRVQIEIPDDWTINDADHRNRVREFAEKSLGTSGHHTASLSVSSYPAPSRMFVRVSFVKIEPPLTQAEVLREIQSNRQQVISDIAEMWKAESHLMWAAAAKMGIKEVGRPSFAVEQLGGQTAIVIRYARTSSNNRSDTVKVAQYHVHLGAEKVLVTLSYIDGDKVVAAAHDRIKNSIAIR